MSGVPLEEQDELLAAELALGLLDGDELRTARIRAATDPDFAEAVARWEARLAPLADEIPGAEPGPHVWEGIARAVATAPAADANVVPIRRALARWRAAAVGMAAIAASLTALIAYRSAGDAPPAVVAPTPAPMMIATLSSPQTDASLSVAYDPQQASMLVTPGRLEGAPGHAHQLWIIPPGGTPVSLGMVRPGAPLRMPVPAQLKPHFRASATLAISVEPTGGSPTGQPTGPVIASGALTTI